MHHEVDFVHSIVSTYQHSFPGIYHLRLLGAIDLIRALNREHSGALGNVLQRNDGILRIVYVPFPQLLYEIIELPAIEFLLQRIRFVPRQVEFAEVIFGYWKVVIVEGLVDRIEDPFRYADLLEYEKQSPPSLQNPIQVVVVGQAISKRQGPVQVMAFLLRQSRDDVVPVHRRIDLLVAPPGIVHGYPAVDIIRRCQSRPVDGGRVGKSGREWQIVMAAMSKKGLVWVR